MIKTNLRKNVQNHFSTEIMRTFTNNVDRATAQALLSITYAVSLHDDLHKQVGKQFYGLRGKITNTLGVDVPLKSLVIIAKQGPSAPDKLEKIYEKISSWLQNEFGDRSTGLINYDPNDLVSNEKLFAYQDALSKIVNLGYDFTSPTLNTISLFMGIRTNTELLMNFYDTKYWNDDVSKSYLNVYQITKNLGFDPLTLRANPSNSLLDPHHFKAFPFRKMSTNTQDLIVTSKRFHGKYEALKNEMGWRAAQVYVETLIISLEELVNLKDSSGNLVEIKDSDIRQVLQENFGRQWESVYKGWISEFTEGMDGIGNYKDALVTLNDRRMKYMPGNIYRNIYRDFLSIEYSRVFYNNYLKHLQGNIVLSRYVATQEDADHFNLLFRSFSRIRLI